MNSNWNTAYRRMLSIAPFLLALAVRLILLFGWEQTVAHDGMDYVVLAKRIASGIGFLDDDGSIYALRTPGFPALLGGWYALFGGSLIGSGCFLLALESFSIPLVYFLTKCWSDARTARIAIWIWAVLPFSPANALAHHSDWLALLLLLSLLLSYRPLPAAGIRLLAIGLLSGLLALMRPVYQIVPVFLVVDFLWQRYNQKTLAVRQWIVSSLLVIVGYLAVTTPWQLRNYQHIGTFTLAAQLGTNLYVGHHEGATGGYAFRPEDYRDAPVGNARLRDQYFMTKAISFLTGHPERELSLIVQKVVRSVAPESREWINYQPSLETNRPNPVEQMHPLLWILLTLLSLVSTLLLWIAVWKKPGSILPFLFFLLAMGTQWLFFASPRFRLPVVPIAIALFAMMATNGELRKLLKTKNVFLWSGTIFILIVNLTYLFTYL